MAKGPNEAGRNLDDADIAHNPLEGVMDVPAFNGARAAVRNAIGARAHLFGGKDGVAAREDTVTTSDMMSNNT